MVIAQGQKSKILAFVIAFVFVVSMAGITKASVSSAASKAPKKFSLSVSSRTVDVQGQATVKVTSVKPAKASKAVTWKSANKSIATVSKKGVIKGIKEGKVKITAVSKVEKSVKKSIAMIRQITILMATLSNPMNVWLMDF